jgi:Zn-finger nucleic acid-binding protein
MNAPPLACPRDATELTGDRMQGVHVDRCSACRGVWLDLHELEELEATRVSEDVRRGTIEFSARGSDLGCPVCGKPMRAFNYRAHNLELEICDEHGYWLDHGEDRHVLDVLEERRRGMGRIASAEAAWHRARQGGGGQGITDRIRRFFGR